MIKSLNMGVFNDCFTNIGRMFVFPHSNCKCVFHRQSLTNIISLCLSLYPSISLALSLSLSLSLYVHIYIYTHIHTYICMHSICIYAYLSLSLSLSLYIYIYITVTMLRCIHIIYICIYTYMCYVISLYYIQCLSAYTYTYIHAYVRSHFGSSLQPPRLERGSPRGR